MRIGISGTHFSGKSTLIREVLRFLPGYIGVNEPYFILEQEGYLFSDPHIVEDYEAQCKRPSKLILESEKNSF